MSINDKTLAVMKAINQALATRGWCLVRGGIGVGKTSAIREALHQTGWEALWKGWPALEAQETRTQLSTEAKECLVLDGLVDEWAPGETQTSNPSWTAFYAATTVAMDRAKLGLLTIVCVAVQEEQGEIHPDLESLPGCVVVTLR